ncbi:PilZ domain-containing protein [Geodermatophilus amargosae]|uniref:PilZ domain-containing protein n=1 Tax=Geodermatophilus amargosae TaxID=1296565 RepID=UPI0034DF91AB
MDAARGDLGRGDTAGTDRPAAGSDAEVVLPDRGTAVGGFVQSSSAGELRLQLEGDREAPEVAPGDDAEVSWRGPDTRRVGPARVTAVEGSTWVLALTGPGAPSQRRQAVRALVVVPVTARHGGSGVAGDTVDLSESGARVLLRARPPVAAGGTLTLAVALDDGELALPAQVVRSEERGARTLVSLRFVAPGEREQDRLRRRVFRALREQSARAAGR